METHHKRGAGVQWSNLETFLRGMETKEGGPASCRHAALKPSLEGWKPLWDDLQPRGGVPLKPSLEGWKRPVQGRPRVRGRALKPSLEGWKPAGDEAVDPPRLALKPSLEGWKPISMA